VLRGDPTTQTLKAVDPGGAGRGKGRGLPDGHAVTAAALVDDSTPAADHPGEGQRGSPPCRLMVLSFDARPWDPALV